MGKRKVIFISIYSLLTSFGLLGTVDYLKAFAMPISSISNKTNNSNQTRLQLYRDSFNISIPGVKKASQATLSNENSKWESTLVYSGGSQKYIKPKILSLPEAGIKAIEIFALGRDPKTKHQIYGLKVESSKGYTLKEPKIMPSEDILTIKFTRPIPETESTSANNKTIINSPKSIEDNLTEKESNLENRQRASAPPLGDMAIGTMVLKSRGYIKLDGPNISMTLKEEEPKNAIMSIAKLGSYGFIYVPDKPSSESGDLLPKVTITIKNEPYDRALNSVLLASGLQAKKEGNLILVGPNVLGKSFGPKISKVYRLNQASAASAADYLASLGALISKVNVTSTSTSYEDSGVSSGPKITLKDTSIQTYGAVSGPLTGLIGTTDSRLQTITLIGDHNLISIADKYLKQLDLRQRQVALSVKILDVNLKDGTDISNSFSQRFGNTFFINDGGELSAIFGGYVPPANKSVESATVNPGYKYPDKQLMNFLKAKVTSTATKVLASPTLLLSENNEEVKSGSESSGASEGLTSGKIGRPFANESFVTVGTQVITNYNVSAGQNGAPPTCNPSFGTAGLTFGARVSKIDDNGFVTFTISPTLSASTSVRTIPTCGPVDILSIRKLDTGTIRVRDGQTLILTGVISDDDKRVISKWPIVGDIPLIGSLFRQSTKGRSKSELVILVTPRIINDNQPIGVRN